MRSLINLPTIAESRARSLFLKVMAFNVMGFEIEIGRPIAGFVSFPLRLRPRRSV
jgi:hypothetical protein